jgi:kynurenine formamidase
VVWAEVEGRIGSQGLCLGFRPVSNLIDTPNWFSVVVALLAGIVGVISLTKARSATLIGVFILVTTIPAASDTGVSFGMDRIAMNVHGNADSHIDALCHVIFDGTLHNGVDADTVDENGAAELSIDVAADGIVGRGVLLDAPRARGVPWLEPGDHVTVDDLLAAERDQGVRVGRGDIVLVRVGHRRRRTEQGPWNGAEARAGLHPTVLPVLAERQIAVLGGDGNNDTAPSSVEGVDFPVHVLAVNALGLHLLDYLQFTELAAACAGIGRWSFLCVIAPLRLPTGTGSPVNPIAVL